MRKRGIFVTNPGGDHGAAFLLQGLIENDWDIYIHDVKYALPSPPDAVIMGWLPGYRNPWYFHDIATIDAIFVESTRTSALASAQALRQQYPHTPLILHDGEDRPWPDAWALDVLKPEWYLKREWGNSGNFFKMPANTLAYPFSCPSQVESVEPSKPFSVFCVMGNSHPFRVEIINHLKQNLPPEVLADSKIGIAGEDFPYFPWREYISYLKGCRVAVQVHGCGIDTAGFWEAICCADTVLRDSSILDLPVPDGIDLCNPARIYETHEHLLKMILQELENDQGTFSHARNSLTHNSCKARAAHMLKTIGF